MIRCLGNSSAMTNSRLEIHTTTQESLVHDWFSPFGHEISAKLIQKCAVPNSMSGHLISNRSLPMMFPGKRMRNGPIRDYSSRLQVGNRAFLKGSLENRLTLTDFRSLF